MFLWGWKTPLDGGRGQTFYDLLHGTLMRRNARIEFRDDTEDCGADLAL
jgi:hypothetical protein